MGGGGVFGDPIDNLGDGNEMVGELGGDV